ncbi:hypothetical protein MMPV_004255 [Pyropia vietnamensis]
MSLILLFVAALCVGGCVAPSEAVPEAYVYAPTAPSAYPMERRAFLSHRDLVAVLANDTKMVDPTGTLRPEDIPPPTPVTCGGTLPGTDHTVVCVATPPVGGWILEPPARCRSSGTLILLHGYVPDPQRYTTAVRALLISAPDLFRSLRVVVPFAPRYKKQLVQGFQPDVYSWFDANPLAANLFGELVNLTTVGEVEARLVSAPEDADRLGLFLSTRRIEAIVHRERRLLRRAGGVHRRGGRIVLLGHSVGAAMATHVALVSTAPLAGVVALQGFLAAPRSVARLASAGAISRARRPYTLDFVAGGADPIVPPLLVKASSRVVRRALSTAGRVVYESLGGVTHASFFFPGDDAAAVARVLRRHF